MSVFSTKYMVNVQNQYRGYVDASDNEAQQLCCRSNRPVFIISFSVYFEYLRFLSKLIISWQVTTIHIFAEKKIVFNLSIEHWDW